MKLENQIIHGDCLEAMKDIPDKSIDMICTDPPYGYNFMGKSWDKTIVSVDIWKECLRVLKHGSFCFVMSSPRQDVLSRMIVRLEDAGFNMGFTSLYWAYASGFPKATNISKMIDKREGVEREVIGKYKRPDGTKREYENWNSNNKISNVQNKALTTVECRNITKPATDEAKKFDGSYGGFQPKPAVEIILVCMKPLSEKTFVDQVMKNGKGVTWLDDCRIPFNENTDTQPRIRKGKKITAGDNNMIYSKGVGNVENIDYFNNKGRFPANLLVSDDVLNDGNLYESGLIKKHHNAKIDNNGNIPSNVYGKYKVVKSDRGIGDSGSFSRYFDLDAWTKEAQKVYPFMLIPKASKSEKNEGCNELEEKEHHILESRPCDYKENSKRAEFVMRKPTKNIHPTVKPVTLMYYLITLASRVGDIILDPFAGSGTMGIAAINSRRKYILIEREKEYYDIIVKRIEEAQEGMALFRSAE